MTEEDIRNICSRYNIDKYIINDDLSIDVDGSVHICAQNIEALPLVFNKVSRNFDCSRNKLTTLYGAPREVGGSFYCSNNDLKTLEHSPVIVRNDYYCRDCKLTSLKGAPVDIGGSFFCFGNRLTSLLYAPKNIWGDFNCSENYLTTLEHLPEFGGRVILYSNNFNQDALFSDFYKIVKNPMYYSYETFECIKGLLPHPNAFIEWAHRTERLQTIENIIKS